MSAVASHDHMVADFDLDQLPGADEITSHPDVGFGRFRLPCYAANGISGVIPLG